MAMVDDQRHTQGADTEAGLTEESTIDWRIPASTQQALDWTIADWSILTSLLAPLGREELETKGAIGEWSLRDLLAHLGANHRWMSGQLDILLLGEAVDPVRLHATSTPPSDPNLLGDQDGRNAFDQALRADWSLEQVYAEGTIMFAHFVASMARIPDDAWTRDVTLVFDDLRTHVEWSAEPGAGAADGAEAGEPPMQVPLWRLVCGYAWHHYPIHTADIRRALATRGTESKI